MAWQVAGAEVFFSTRRRHCHAGAGRLCREARLREARQGQEGHYGGPAKADARGPRWGKEGQGGAEESRRRWQSSRSGRARGRGGLGRGEVGLAADGIERSATGI